MKSIPQWCGVLLCVVALNACQIMNTKSSPDSTAVVQAQCPGSVAVKALADDAFRATLWQQSAAEYDALCLQVFARADAMLHRAMAEASWSALHPSEARTLPKGAPLAIITDIDETLLDNSAFSVRQMREPAPACMTVAEAKVDWDRRWLEWVNEGEAKAIPGAANFMRTAATHGGVEIFYVTNRKDNERAATCKNLIDEGFPLVDCNTHVLMRNEEEGRKKDKVSRRASIAATHRVVLMFGDNLGDFVGNVMTDESQRAALVAERQMWWGERWFMLPNPSYGTWDEVLSQIKDRPDEFATAAERNAYVRAQKERRLEDCRNKDCLKP
jgi:5'-nucleotidase (lipoprotein e(P4) family)